ncbi:MAG: nitroreductase family protein [Coriobacteriia bacterium]
MTGDGHLRLEWLDAVPVRRSRRSFDGRAFSADLGAGLLSMTREFRPFPDSRAVFVDVAPQSLFAGILGSYGGVSGAPSAMLFVGDTASPYAAEHVGYMGEALVLDATLLGLATCWIGGLFSGGVAERLATLAPGERVFAVSPVGHALVSVSGKERVLFGAGREKKRLSLEDIAPGYHSWPPWAQRAIETVRPAPSAMHAQPWRFRMADDALIVAYHGAERVRVSKRLDVGIAMLHAELGALSEGAHGVWTPLASPDVARFEVD